MGSARGRVSARSLRCCRKGMETMRAVVVVGTLLGALCSLSLTSCSTRRAVDSDLVETETGWQFGDHDDDDDGNMQTFDTPALVAAKPQGNVIQLTNGDFELIVGNGTATFLADSTSTAILNWTPGGSGVQVLQGATYGQPATAKTKSVYCIHLNNPGAAANGTQGSLSTTLATAPASGKVYTVHYDVCRAPDGPANLWSALRVSVIDGSTVHDYVIRNVKYNPNDTIGHSTWTKQSLVYTGTGAATVIKFESMSEKYGPIIDNVQILSGSHPLAGAPLGKLVGLCQRLLPLVTGAALASLHLF